MMPGAADPVRWGQGTGLGGQRPLGVQGTGVQGTGSGGQKPLGVQGTGYRVGG